MLFSHLLRRTIKQGTLQLITADGKEYAFGSGEPRVTIKLHRKSLEWSLGLNPELRIGEAYADGGLTIEEGSLQAFLDILFLNASAAEAHPLYRLLNYLNGRAVLVRQFNPLDRARRNVKYHYDMPDRLYDFFLDPARQYSCAYFTDIHNGLAEAQQDKMRHIAAKLLLDKPGLKLLDIGSGWGGFGAYLTRKFGCRTTGLTLSTHQYKISRDRARAEGLDARCRFKLQDYRLETGVYDRIVSVGMFEHVGRKNYDEFFGHLRNRLADDGVCLLHTISHFGSPRPMNPFIHKYIFPGADIPALSEILEPLQWSGLYVTDIEILRLHYAETLKHWAERFAAHKDGVVRLCGENLYRRWMFYFTGCAAAFRHGYMMVAQLQISKRLAAVPIIRDYMYETEHAEGLNAEPMRTRQ